MRKLVVVTPVFNEIETILQFWKRLRPQLTADESENWLVRAVLVDDGSIDGSIDLLKASIPASDWKFLTVIRLSRNFGHQQAVWAGIQSTAPDECILVMDSDLQDPPEMIEKFLESLESGDVVIAKRRSRQDSLLKKATAKIYYKFVSTLSGGIVREDVGDFWALSERAGQALKGYSEGLLFFRGLIMELGYRRIELVYDRDARFAGVTKYSLLKMIQLAIAGVTGFSIKPLVYIVYVAILSGVLASIAAMFLVVSKLIGAGEFSPGIVFVGVSVLVGLTTMHLSIGVIGLYVARVAIETKKRPHFFIDSVSRE